MSDWFSFLYHRFRERLWIKPAAISGVSLAAIFFAKSADAWGLASVAPEISVESVRTLLQVIASSMLVMAIFAVGSMVSAYASVGSSATPRAFPLIIADDVSQNALTAFIGAFLFSIVALFALENGYYDRGGRFALVSLTFIVFGVVILTFLWWVDRIARLGRLNATIDKVESATARAMKRRRKSPRLGGAKWAEPDGPSEAIYGEEIGYVQQVKMAALQSIAEKYELHIHVGALPGTFATPGRPLAYVRVSPDQLEDVKRGITAAFVVGRDRVFDQDPRFGLVVLSEIASRALSPGINDSGSAIAVIGALVRLLAFWCEPVDYEQAEGVEFDRVAVPSLKLDDLFDDAFTMIARDGARAVEVVLRLQKGLESLAVVCEAESKQIPLSHARKSIARAEKAMELSDDLEAVKSAGRFANAG
ncbi:hypothetical protein VN12_20360 [Pirellula sp. SH-Sr6A]|uniref:DUF2254 domain-containing protein n=1 Tax=Pirellula sp. SH-Sr6A TaxID=1632865 RepID=UPI00078C7C0C|nr:DUF2254 domain-containing protein [Pirellula sp. SH-Sr6A]AMV34490.1 hypothetical protein VN12_20360 [Pirellula sp. SH-Sr6A]